MKAFFRHGSLEEQGMVVSRRHGVCPLRSPPVHSTAAFGRKIYSGKDVQP